MLLQRQKRIQRQIYLIYKLEEKMVLLFPLEILYLLKMKKELLQIYLIFYFIRKKSLLIINYL